MGAKMGAKRGQKWGKSGAEKHSLEPTVTNGNSGSPVKKRDPRSES